LFQYNAAGKCAVPFYRRTTHLYNNFARALAIFGRSVQGMPKLII